MLRRFGIYIAFAMMLGISAPAVGQTASAPPHKSLPSWKQYCQPDGGFCFKYPSSWIMLGSVYDGKGVVVAPQQKQDRSLWNQVTVALMLPPPAGDEEPPSLDNVIETATTGLHEGGQALETLQRQRRTVDGLPAEMLKVRYHEKSNNADWVEEIVFIQGDENEIYSVALKCSPESLARMEASFAGVLKSWKLPEAANPADSEEGTPKQSTPPGKSPTATPH